MVIADTRARSWARSAALEFRPVGKPRRVQVLLLALRPVAPLHLKRVALAAWHEKQTDHEAVGGARHRQVGVVLIGGERALVIHVWLSDDS